MIKNKLTPLQRIAEAIQSNHKPYREELYLKETWKNPGTVKKTLLVLSKELLHKYPYKEAMARAKSGNIL
jgi:hypothetical protein